jgi:hypothetical protein
MRPDFQKNVAFFFFEGRQTSPFVPLLKEILNVKMNLEYWWNDTDRGKPSTRKETPTGANFYHKSDLGWSEV